MPSLSELCFAIYGAKVTVNWPMASYSNVNHFTFPSLKVSYGIGKSTDAVRDLDVFNSLIAEMHLHNVMCKSDDF